MKKFQLILILNFALFYSYCSAQKFSIEPNIGYNFYPGNSIVGIDDVFGYTGTNFVTSVQKNIKGSFGQGLSFGVDMSYKICTHVAVNLGASLLIGKQFIVPNSLVLSPNNPAVDSEILNGTILRILPGIIFTCNEDKKIQPFLRTELVLGLYSSFKDETVGFYETDLNPSGPPTPIHYEEIIIKHGGIGLGYGMALGTIYQITNRIGISAEINGIHQTYGFTNGEETYYNGNVSPNGAKFVYQDDVNNTIANTSNTQIQLKEYYPFSSIGVKVGIRFTF